MDETIKMLPHLRSLKLASTSRYVGPENDYLPTFIAPALSTLFVAELLLKHDPIPSSLTRFIEASGCKLDDVCIATYGKGFISILALEEACPSIRFTFVDHEDDYYYEDDERYVFYPRRKLQQKLNLLMQSTLSKPYAKNMILPDLPLPIPRRSSPVFPWK